MDCLFSTLQSFEIPSLIQKAALFGGVVHQAASVDRVMAPIQNIDLDNYGTLFVKLTKSIEIHKKKPVAIKLNYRNISFLISANEFEVEGQTLITQVPKTAKAIPLRNDERYILPLDSQIKANIHRIEKRGEIMLNEASLLDISSRGLGILIPNAEEHALQKNDHLWIKSINGFEFKNPIFSNVIYTQGRKYKDGTFDIKAGVALATELPNDCLLSVKELSRLILKA